MYVCVLVGSFLFPHFHSHPPQVHVHFTSFFLISAIHPHYPSFSFSFFYQPRSPLDLILFSKIYLIIHPLHTEWIPNFYMVKSFLVEKCHADAAVWYWFIHRCVFFGIIENGMLFVFGFGLECRLLYSSMFSGKAENEENNTIYWPNYILSWILE